MSKEIGLTPSQQANLLSKRPAIHKERKNLQACEKMIKDLRVAAGQHLRSLHQTMDEIQTAMTPTQLAKFYLSDDTRDTVGNEGEGGRLPFFVALRWSHAFLVGRLLSCCCLVGGSRTTSGRCRSWMAC